MNCRNGQYVTFILVGFMLADSISSIVKSEFFFNVLLSWVRVQTGGYIRIKIFIFIVKGKEYKSIFVDYDNQIPKVLALYKNRGGGRGEREREKIK